MPARSKVCPLSASFLPTQAERQGTFRKQRASCGLTAAAAAWRLAASWSLLGVGGRVSPAGRDRSPDTSGRWATCYLVVTGITRCAPQTLSLGSLNRPPGSADMCLCLQSSRRLELTKLREPTPTWPQVASVLTIGACRLCAGAGWAT